MRETLLLLSGFILLSGSANFDVLAIHSIPHLLQSASIRQPRAASLSSWDPSSKEQILAIRGNQIHSSMTRELKRQYEIAAYRRKRTHTRRAPPAAPSPRIATLKPVIDKKDIKLKHRLIADQTFRLMPSRCADILQNFYVRYDNPTHRGLGGKSTMILSGNVPDNEFRALFIHEYGHLIDLGCFIGSPAAGPTPYMDRSEKIWKNDPSVSFYRISWINATSHRRGVQPEDFVSGYASWDAFEDFAESFAYYMLHREVFARRAAENASLAAKYHWMEQHFPNMPKVATSQTRWHGTIPWDITKLAYSWRPPSDLVARR